MSLTGTTLPLVLGVLCVLLFVAMAAGFPRLRRRWAAVAARGGGLVLLNVLVLALVGALLNDRFAFYVSWSDLAGARSPVSITHHGASARSAVGALAGAGTGLTAASVLPVLPAPGRRLQEYTVTGPSGVKAQIAVLLPQGYSAASAARYPVVEALHGLPGNTMSWLRGMHLQQSLDAAVAARLIHPLVVVMPQLNVPYGVDSECVNGPAGTPQIETWLAQDVPAFVASHFRVRTDRGSWAVAGYSEGGWCAAMLGMHHSRLFSAAVVFSGSFLPDFSRYRPFGSTTPAAYNLAAQARRNPPRLAMWVQSSKQDGYSYPQTAQFLRSVRAPLSVTTELLKSGGHRLQLWSGELPTALRWLGSSLPGFAP